MSSKNERKVPDFLCIGAQRSGSTWLYKMLREHSQIWLPPIKELHYFDQLRIQPYFCKRFRGHLLERWRENKKALFSGEHVDLLWDLKLLRWPHTDQWYISLFPLKKDIMAGEITPAYSTLQSDVISTISQINPDLKIIFLIRDPIERSWSHARRTLPRLHNKPVEKIPANKVIEWFHTPDHILRSDYAGTLERWLQYFPRDQIFLGFFEDICKKPQDLLCEIFSFLGIKSSVIYDKQFINQAVLAGTHANLPSVYEFELAKLHEPNLAKLIEFIQGPAINWHKRCLEIIGKSLVN